jgi:hypothetical protein
MLEKCIYALICVSLHIDYCNPLLDVTLIIKYMLLVFWPHFVFGQNHLCV